MKVACHLLTQSSCALQILLCLVEYKLIRAATDLKGGETFGETFVQKFFKVEMGREEKKRVDTVTHLVILSAAS